MTPFLQLTQDDATAFRLRIDSRLCVGLHGNAFMFGGVGLAAAVTAAEHATSRAVIWACAQFLSYARLGDDIEFSVSETSTGRNISQVSVTGRVAGNTILTVNAALGARDGFADDQWAVPPDMPPPEQCEPVALWPEQDERTRLMEQLDLRSVPGR
jgi:acyl-CoA thioesterase-2